MLSDILIVFFALMLNFLLIMFSLNIKILGWSMLKTYFVVSPFRFVGLIVFLVIFLKEHNMNFLLYTVTLYSLFLTLEVLFLIKSVRV